MLRPLENLASEFWTPGPAVYVEYPVEVTSIQNILCLPVCKQDDSWISAVLSCLIDEQSLYSFQMSPLFLVMTYYTFLV